MTDDNRLRFWQAMVLVGPVAAAAATFVGTSMLGAFDDFQWLGKEPSPFAAFGILGTMLFPVAAFFWVQIRCDEASVAVSRSWPTVTGTFLSSDIQTISGRYGTAYELTVSYAYEVAGIAYMGDMLSFGPRRLPSLGVAQAFARKYTPNMPVAVHYDPDGPDLAVLEITDDLAVKNTWRVWLSAAMPFVGALVMAVRHLFH